MRSRPLISVIFITAAVTGLCPGTFAAPFGGGNVVVYRVGNGTSEALANTGNSVFLDEYNTKGQLIQSVPVSGTGPNALVASGNATSDGLLTHANGALTVTGYNRALGTGTGSVTSSAVNRVIATYGTTGAGNGTQTSFTSLSDLGVGNNVRSGVFSGSSVFGTGAAGGIRTPAVGTVGTSIQVSGGTISNFRQVNIFGGQLFASTNSGTPGIYAVGTGVSTAANQPLTPILTATGSSPYSFFFADLSASVGFGNTGLDTLYVADDGAAALTKYSLVGSAWVSNGTIGVAADAYRGLAGAVVGANVSLFATRAGGTGAGGGGELVRLVDGSGYNGTFSGTPALIASAVTGTSFNTAFRGVALIPPVVVTVPETNTFALLTLVLSFAGGAIIARRRK